MRTPIIRPFMPADAPAWVDLNNLIFDRQATLAQVQEQDRTRPAGHFLQRWMAEDGGEVVGEAALYFFPFDPPGHLHVMLGVHPQRRGQGLGRALWQTVLETAQGGKRVRGLVTDVSDLDAASRAWAERRGFLSHAHRYASELDLTTFDETPHRAALERAEAQGVRFTDLAGADEATLERFLDFYADRLTETPDLAGHPRWPRAQVWQALALDHDPRPDWFVLAVAPDGTWLGTSVLRVFRHARLAYNELTATHPQARGRGLALPLKLQVIRRAQAEGLPIMRTNNHSQNAPMLAVNRRLGFVSKPGRFEMHRPAPEQ